MAFKTLELGFCWIRVSALKTSYSILAPEFQMIERDQRKLRNNFAYVILRGNKFRVLSTGKSGFRSKALAIVIMVSLVRMGEFNLWENSCSRFCVVASFCGG